MKNHVWTIYHDCALDTFGWIKLMAFSSRKLARERVNKYKSADSGFKIPYRYKIIKEYV